MTPYDNYQNNQWVPPWLQSAQNAPIPPFQQPPMPPFSNPSSNNNQGSNNQMPLSAPPTRIPQRSANTRAIDAGSIRNCLGRFTYIWMNNGRDFWIYPIQVGRRSVSGFRWDNRFGWVYFGVSLEQIDSFTCV